MAPNLRTLPHHDQDGKNNNSSNPKEINNWYWRLINLSDMAGKTVKMIDVVSENDVPNLNWACYYNFINIRQYNTSTGVANTAPEEQSPAPVAYWKFDEGQGVVANSTTWQKAGTITNLTVNLFSRNQCYRLGQ